MEGLLLIDKPETWTSFDVVNYVRRIVAQVDNKKSKNVKVGHCGTLDPFASGLLILLIGKKYTRLASNYSKLDKVYSVTAKLGYRSTTQDIEGQLEQVSNIVPTKLSIKEAVEHFRGEISQTPPSYSAIKVNGQRAYKLARAGEVPELKPRQVTIHKLEVEDYAYPELKLLCEVSSGTYIRTLVADIGEDLGVGAYATQLRRLSIDKYSIDQAVTPKSLTTDNLSRYLIEVISDK